MPKPPPVPPANRSPKGPGADPKVSTEDSTPARENFEQQGRHGNIHQNTHNQGYQQDR
jgi:hypothetical protein